MIKCYRPLTFKKKSLILNVDVTLLTCIPTRHMLNKHYRLKSIPEHCSCSIWIAQSDTFQSFKGAQNELQHNGACLLNHKRSDRTFPWHWPFSSHPARMRVFIRHAWALPPTSAVLRELQTQYKPFWNTDPWRQATLLSIRPSFLRRNLEPGHWNPIWVRMKYREPPPSSPWDAFFFHWGLARRQHSKLLLTFRERERKTVFGGSE